MNELEKFQLVILNDIIDKQGDVIENLRIENRTNKQQELYYQMMNNISILKDIKFRIEQFINKGNHN